MCRICKKSINCAAMKTNEKQSRSYEILVGQSVCFAAIAIWQLVWQMSIMFTRPRPTQSNPCPSLNLLHAKRPCLQCRSGLT